MRRFVISDIHGCNKTFNEALDKIGLNKEDQLYLLGDYIDRGPDSKGVIDTIFHLQDNGYDIKCLKGNHEQMLIDAWHKMDFSYTRRWLFHGGAQTVESFGGFGIEKIGQRYRDFLQGLKHSFSLEKEILVHAGLGFKQKENPLDDEHSKLWIRNWYKDINYQWLGEKKIIHGHTPRDIAEIQNMMGRIDIDKFLDIDAGCCYINVNGLGYLCVLEMEKMNIFFQKNVD